MYQIEVIYRNKRYHENMINAMDNRQFMSLYLILPTFDEQIESIF